MNRRSIFAAGIVSFIIAIAGVAMWLAAVAPTMDMRLSVQQFQSIGSRA